MMIAAPPSFVGGEKLTVADPSPALMPVMVGASGTLAGVTLFEGADGALLPMALVAITVQVIAVPLASPVTVIGDALPDCDCAPQVAV